MTRSALLAPILSLLLFAACAEQPIEPESSTAPDAPIFKKGGKPGGGGGGGGGAPADPAIAYNANGALRVMNADGSNSTTVVPDGEFYGWPSWAPFGAGTSAADPFRIVYLSENDGLATVDVFVVDGSIQASVPPPIARIDGCCPAWSPDGARIAYTTENLLGVIEIGPAGLPEPSATILYSGPSSGILAEPSWSPDSDAIAFVEHDFEQGSSAVKIYHISGGFVETIIKHTDLPDVLEIRHGPDWGRSSTNLKLAFTASRLVRKKRGPARRVYGVYTVALQRDALTGHYSAAVAGLAQYEIDGKNSSWSPDDSQWAMNGITVFDIESGGTTSLSRTGSMADWKR